MSEANIKKVDKILDKVYATKKTTAARSLAAVAEKPKFKEIWPAIRAILLIAKSTLGLFKPKWKVAIDAFIASLDVIVAGGTVEDF